MELPNGVGKKAAIEKRSDVPIEALLVRTAHHVLAHWHEFGPRYGFEAMIDDLEQALDLYTSTQILAEEESS